MLAGVISNVVFAAVVVNLGLRLKVWGKKSAAKARRCKEDFVKDSVENLTEKTGKELKENARKINHWRPAAGFLTLSSPRLVIR